MPRTTVHVCSQCGFQSAQWHGQCPGCEAWNTLVEEPLAASAGERRSPGSARGRQRLHRGGGASGTAPRAPARPLREVGSAPLPRMSTGVGELDRVLGGGLVAGALVLLGGSPGVGKPPLT